MNREDYYKKLGWKKSPFIKSTSIEIPIIGRVDEFNEVCECIGGWDRIMVVTAPIGYGKTTFLNQLVMDKPKGVKYVVAFNAYEPPEEVMGRIKAELPFLKRLFKTDRTGFGEALQGRLGNDKMLLLFDEAQDYQEDLFKWLRILNDRTDNLFMMFLGLQGLDDKITSETSFRDRKSKSIRLKPFDIEDLEEIVKERIKWCGGKDIAPFTEGGLKRLCESCSHIPRQLLENGQKVIEECASKDVLSADENFVEQALGKVSHEYVRKPQNKTHTEDKPQDEVLEVVETGAENESEDEVEPTADAAVLKALESGYNFMNDLSPTQQDIVQLLLEKESLSITELSEAMKKDIRSIGSLIRKLRGLNKMEVARKPNVPYPVIVRKGKEIRMGRLQYVYSLSDTVRRIVAKK